MNFKYNYKYQGFLLVALNLNIIQVSVEVVPQERQQLPEKSLKP